MFLTREELIDLAGTTRPKVIARWLDRQGIRHIVGIDGWPRVLKSIIEGRLGGSSAKPEPRLRLG